VRPTAADAGKLYPSDYAPYVAAAASNSSASSSATASAGPGRSARRVTKAFERVAPDMLPGLLDEVYHPRPPGVLVDYGCGGPAFLERARARGWETTIGVDMNVDVVDAVAAAGHRGVPASEVDRAIDDGSVAVFRLNHVFEHLYDPVEVLVQLRAKLAPSGFVHLAVPNGDSVWASLFREDWFNADPRHLVLYGPDQLRVVAERAGFTRVEIVHEVITRDIARSWGYVRERRGRLSHDRVGALGADRRLAAALDLPARLSASVGRGDRFHAVLGCAT
jgi:predicted SAM-dependent methyltransferase